MYGSTVTGVELLNEPRLSDAHFSMSQLKDFYAQGAGNISTTSSHNLNVTIHGPSTSPVLAILCLTKLQMPSMGHSTGPTMTHLAPQRHIRPMV